MKIKDIIKIVEENSKWKKELELAYNISFASVPWGIDCTNQENAKEYYAKKKVYEEWLETEIQL